MSEVWRTVPSVPEIEASSSGRIRRKPYTVKMPNGGERHYISKPTHGCKAATSGLAGFRMIYRYRGLKRTFKIHRLVCEAFHGPAPEGQNIVMHIDDDPTNNTPENLKWATQKENLNAKQFIDYCKSRIGENSPTIKGRGA